MRTIHPEHLKAFGYRGPHRYFLTFCTDFRRRLFLEQGPVTLVAEQILRASVEKGFSVIAYCFMPDHLHLLIEGLQEDSDCLAFIKLAKQYSGFYYSKNYKQKLWQRYGYEHILRDEEVTLVVARYILQNPVRAGLVEDATQYPFSGSQIYSVEQLLNAM